MNQALPGSRTSARIAAVQALYEMDMTDAGPDPILNEFMAARWKRAGRDEDDDTKSADVDDLPPFDDELLRQIVGGVAGDTATLDNHIAGALTGKWTVERLEILIRAILRAASYELLNNIDVPLKVILNEYMGVSHSFFSGSEPSLINGVMDSLGRKLRPHESGGDSASS